VAQLGLFVVTIRLALRSSRLSRRPARAALGVAVAGSAAAAGVSLTRPSGDALAAASLWTGLLLLATVLLIVVRIVAFGTVTAQSIYGAVSAYLIIGLMFAAFYAAISQGHGGHFFADGQPGDSQTFQYFSFTTLTTLGYGDFTAAGSDGRALAVMEALTGQVFLATLVARLVAAFRVQGGRRPGGQPAPPGGPGRPGGSAGSGGARARTGPAAGRGQRQERPKWRRGRLPRRGPGARTGDG
jgi:ion channel